MRLSAPVLVSFLGLLCSACAGALTPSAAYQANPQLLSLPPVVVFQGSAGTLSYQTAVGRDAQALVPAQRVRGRACQRGFQIPIFSILAVAGADGFLGAPSSLSAAWGDGTFAAAVDDARRQLPAGAILYDLQADLNYRSILTVYLERCVSIDAGVLVEARTRASEHHLPGS